MGEALQRPEEDFAQDVPAAGEYDPVIAAANDGAYQVTAEEIADTEREIATLEESVAKNVAKSGEGDQFESRDGYETNYSINGVVISEGALRSLDLPKEIFLEPEEHAKFSVETSKLTPEEKSSGGEILVEASELHRLAHDPNGMADLVAGVIVEYRDQHSQGNEAPVEISTIDEKDRMEILAEAEQKRKMAIEADIANHLFASGDGEKIETQADDFFSRIASSILPNKKKFILGAVMASIAAGAALPAQARDSSGVWDKEGKRIEREVTRKVGKAASDVIGGMIYKGRKAVGLETEAEAKRRAAKEEAEARRAAAAAEREAAQAKRNAEQNARRAEAEERRDAKREATTEARAAQELQRAEKAYTGERASILKRTGMTEDMLVTLEQKHDLEIKILSEEYSAKIAEAQDQDLKQSLELEFLKAKTELLKQQQSENPAKTDLDNLKAKYPSVKA